MELTGPWCVKPQARLVKVKGDQIEVLAETGLSSSHGLTNPTYFHVQVLNQPDETALQIRLWTFVKKRRGQEQLREWWLQAVDSEEPLRAGTVGVWSNFYHAGWDNFLVRALPGLDSGISGDENGNGVCDIDEGDTGPIEACLDEDFDSKKGTSRWITRVEGKTGTLRSRSMWSQAFLLGEPSRTGCFMPRRPSSRAVPIAFSFCWGRINARRPRVQVGFSERRVLRAPSPGRVESTRTDKVRLESTHNSDASQRCRHVSNRFHRRTRVQMEAFRLEPLPEP